MVDLLLSDSKEIRESTCMALTVMARLADGAEMIVTNTKFLENLAAVLEDMSPEVRIKAAGLLETLTSNWMGKPSPKWFTQLLQWCLIAVFELVSTAFVPVLLDNLVNEDEEITAVHLRSLERLLQAEGKIVALECGGYEILVSRICRLQKPIAWAFFQEDLLDRTDPRIISSAANCISLIANTEDAKEIAFSGDTLVKFNRLLHDEVALNVAKTTIGFVIILSEVGNLFSSCLCNYVHNHINESKVKGQTSQTFTRKTVSFNQRCWTSSS